jgi:rRNA maturation protein Nop10
MPSIMRRELEVTLKDLRFLSLSCADCRTVVSLDMEAKATVDPKTRKTIFSLERCPRCGRAFDSAIPPNVDALYGAYQKVPDTLRSVIAFRVPMGEDRMGN